MDNAARSDLVSSLQKDATFSSFTSNVDRVSYVLEQYITSESIHRQVKENLATVAKKVAKCNHKADCYTEEAKLQMTAKDGTAALVALRKALLYTPPKKAIQKVKLYLMMFQVYFKHLGKYEEALWAIEQTVKASGGTGGTLDSKLAHILYLKATVLKKLRRSEEAMQIVQRLLTFSSAGSSSQTPIAKKLKQKNLKKFLKKLKAEIKTPSYSADLKQWRESHVAQLLPSFKNIAVRGRTTAEYRILEQQVRIESSANVGRYFMASSLIPAETVILQERPISLAVQPTVLGIKCTACYHDLGHRYVPCEQCTAAVYCDGSCAQADALVHSTTCGGMKELLYEKVGTFAMHLLQLITRVGGPKEALLIQTKLADEGYSIDQYMEEKKSMQQQSVVDYKMACILASNEDKQSLESHVKYTVMALETAVAIIHVSVKEGASVSTLLKADFLVPFAARLTTNLRQLSYNVFGWTDWALDLYVGNCQALVGSLVNHSCVANTKWEWKDGVISFIAKREIAAGEQITISYGPSDWQSYSTRQERLNHYLFGCACAACLKDAAAGSAVKCTNCTLGPVVYDSPLNLVPCISGKCLQCFALHPTFADSTSSLKETISQAKALNTVNACFPTSSTDGGEKLLLFCKKLLSSLQQLALPSGKATMESTLTAASVLLLNCTVAMEQLAIEERIHIADLIDQSLPTAFPAELLNSAMMRTTFGWFHLVLKWSEEFNLTPHSQSVNYEPRDCLHMVLQFHRRCQEALKCMVASGRKSKEGDASDDGHKVLSAIVDKQLRQLDMKLDQYREVF